MYHLHPVGDRNGRQEFYNPKSKSLVSSKSLQTGNLGPLLWGQEPPILLPSCTGNHLRSTFRRHSLALSVLLFNKNPSGCQSPPTQHPE